MTRLLLFLTCVSLWAAENPLSGIFGAENLKQAKITGVEVTPGPRPDSLVLRFHAGEEAGSLVVPAPEAARDWTRFGAFTFDFASTSTIRWTLEIRNGKGQAFTYRVQPFADVPVKAAISRAFLTREYMNNRQFKGYWISNWGNHIDLTDVRALAISMLPNRDVTLKLGPLTLLEVPAADELYVKQPVVDALGQWIAADWPEKVRSLDELKRAWSREDQALAKPEDFGFCRYGGWKEKQERATGFFHTARVDGRWWLVDPDGHLFFSVGPDCVRYNDPTLVEGREILFEKLPPGAGVTTDFYRANAGIRYGESSFLGNWKSKAWQRLRAWGFNTVGNWSDAAMFEQAQIPFVTNVRVGRSRKAWQAFPDAYSEQFARSAEEDARAQCGRFRDEPHLIGYFIGNEPRWPYRNLLELILKDTEPSDTQAFVRKRLAEQGDTPAAREALLEALSRKYFQVVRDAIRKADPNHLVLGIRFAGQAPDPVMRANDVFDLFSINIYRFEPPAEQIRRLAAVLDKPILIGEFHFGAPDRGYAPSLVMVKDQTERGVAYQYYAERAAAMPQIVGAHYFQIFDQPVTGRYDGENYNIGLIDQTDRPYPEVVSFARAAHRRVYQVHAGSLEPTNRTAKVR